LSAILMSEAVGVGALASRAEGFFREWFHHPDIPSNSI